MPAAQPMTSPVEDSVPKVDEIAVGENLNFQRKWWKFENFVWSFFALILVADLLGLFGAGWLSKATASTPDHALTLDYERIERSATPSNMILHLGPGAVHDGHIQIFISDSLVKPLGAQRISPQPAVSALSDGGITYTFDATGTPTTVQISLEPPGPGRFHFQVRVLGNPDPDSIDESIVVVP